RSSWHTTLVALQTSRDISRLPAPRKWVVLAPRTILSAGKPRGLKRLRREAPPLDCAQVATHLHPCSTNRIRNNGVGSLTVPPVAIWRWKIDIAYKFAAMRTVFQSAAPHPS